MTRFSSATLALLALSATTLGAQSAAMTVRPESKVTLAGGSNLHEWSCKSSAFQATIELDSAYQTRAMTDLTKPIRKVAVSVPVKSLKCGHDKMDANMYKALREPEFPEIKYVLDSYEVDTALTTRDGFAAKTVGTLTVAGASKQVEIPITALRKSGGAMTGEGTLKFLMTDFGIKPPVALLGTLRTKNEVAVKFEVLLDRTVVVALTQKP